MKKILQILWIMLFAVIFIACEDDEVVEDETPVLGGTGDILVTTMIPNADGMSGSAYMQLTDGIQETLLTNTYAFTVSYSGVPCARGEDVFVIPGWGGTTDVMTKYSRVNNQLEKQWEYLLPTQSGATNVVTKGDIAYVACSFTAEILVVDNSDGTLIKQIDISEYGIGDQNPDAACMVIRDSYLYVGLNQAYGSYMPAMERPCTDVLIIDMENNEVLKMITESESGISTSTRPIDPHSIFVDENNDIYVVCIGAWGFMPGHNAGVLRIKDGETDFDPDYKFIINTTDVVGEDNSTQYMHAVKYYGNGKLYATANFNAYYSDPVDYIQDRTVVPVEIDLQNQTITKLDFPYSNNFGVAVSTYEDYVVFGLATTTDNGFYTYKPATGECSSSAILQTEGYPYTFNSLKN